MRTYHLVHEAVCAGVGQATEITYEPCALIGMMAPAIMLLVFEEGLPTRYGLRTPEPQLGTSCMVWAMS